MCINFCGFRTAIHDFNSINQSLIKVKIQSYYRFFTDVIIKQYDFGLSQVLISCLFNTKSKYITKII